MKKYIALYLLSSTPVQPKAVIFDLGGVLLTTSKLTVARAIGLKHFLWYFIRHQESHVPVMSKVFHVLSLLEVSAAEKEIPYAYVGNKKISVPHVWRSWFAGTITSEEILRRAKETILALDNACYFSNKAEKKLVKKTIKILFNPRHLAHATSIIKKGYKLAQELKERGHDLYILSNWDKESFEHIYNNPKNQHLFNLFSKDKIIISADIQDYKPHRSAFQEVLNRHNLESSSCIFIDDQEENISSASTLGIDAIHLTNQNYKMLRKKLVEKGIL